MRPVYIQGLILKRGRAYYQTHDFFINIAGVQPGGRDPWGLPIGPTAHWSYDPLVLRPIGPTAHWSYGPLVLQLIGLMAHKSYCSDIGV